MESPFWEGKGGLGGGTQDWYAKEIRHNLGLAQNFMAFIDMAHMSSSLTFGNSLENKFHFSVSLLSVCLKPTSFHDLYVFHLIWFVLYAGFDENLDVQGELILQDSFQVWDPKSLIRKGRERHLFLFEISLVFSKEIKDSAGHTKYVYKNKLRVCLLRLGWMFVWAYFLSMKGGELRCACLCNKFGRC